MQNLSFRSVCVGLIAGLIAGLVACGSDGGGGAGPSGGASSGGSPVGGGAGVSGSRAGGSAGAVSTGGSGGASVSGAGGSAAGGANTGGASTGGANTGGSGGLATGGAGAGGAKGGAGGASGGAAGGSGGAPSNVITAVFGGGPFYSGGKAVMDDLRGSGFTTIMLWSIHVNSNADLVLNDKLLAHDGKYVGDAAWPAQLKTLKQAPTAVNRIEISIGSAGVPDFERVRTLLMTSGAGADSVLYKNFAVLKATLPLDAADFDDESAYDVTYTVQFANMLSGLGYAITLCPYTNDGFWKGVRTQLGKKVDRVYLQAYDGGGGNNPATWNQTLGTIVIPGLWSLHGGGGDDPNAVKTKMAGWKKSASIPGGFMWLYDDIQKFGPSSKAYATAIREAVEGK